MSNLTIHTSYLIPSAAIAIVGGSGVYSLDCLEKPEQRLISTPYGDVTVSCGNVQGRAVAFIARHGVGHKIPPHKINYRANIWALRQWGADAVIGLNAVGGIDDQSEPGKLVIPDQLIDYTYGREHTFADKLSNDINHIEFAEPYTQVVRQLLISAGAKVNIDVIEGGCYACMQGPRLETAAEIRKLKSDGNTLVGMTTMPEAALARELSLPYASLCLVANWAAGIGETISMESIEQALKKSATQAQKLIAELMNQNI